MSDADSLTAGDMAEKIALALTNYFSDGSDEFGHVIATQNGSAVYVVAVDEGDADHEERERRYVITVDSEADRDPLTDPANAKVIMALREAGRFTPPPLGEDRVVVMFRDKGLWKPEYDEPDGTGGDVPAPTGVEIAKAIAGPIHADFTDEDVRTATADVMALYQGGMAAEVVRALWGSQR